MSDSVGKISLDLEIQSDISKQISSVSNTIANNLKKSLNSSMKNNLENANSSVKKAISSITSNINSSMKKSMGNVVKTIKTILSNIKMPKIDIPKTKNMSTPKSNETSSNISKRGPPINAEVLNSEIANTTATLDNINARIDQQKEKLAQLKEAYNNAFNPSRKNAIEEKILKTEASINKLIGQSDKLGFKLVDLDSKMAGLGRETNSTNTSLTKSSIATDKASKSINILSNNTKRASNSMRRYSSNIGMIVRSMVIWGMIFPVIIKGITAMGTGLLNNLKTNEQFSNSLAQIKSNLMIAFTPVYNAILPAINVLMSALSTLTQYIASFTSAIFGKTFEQSKQATQGLINAKNAMGAYGDSAKAAGVAAKDALELAGFDEINSLNSQSSNGDSGGASSGVPSLVTPSLETAPIDSSMSELAEKVKKVFLTIFQPFKNAWAKDGASVVEQMKRAIEGTKETFKNFYNVLATPPVQLFIENVARIGLSLIKLALAIYTDFILPIINWFINLLPGAASGLNPLLDGVRGFIDYLSSNTSVLQLVCSLILGIVVAFKAFAFITTIIGILQTIISVISSIGGVIAGTVAIGTGGIAIIIAAIVGLIAAFVALYASNEAFRNKVNEITSAISEFLAPAFQFLKEIVLDVWNNALVPLGAFLLDVCKTVLLPLAKILGEVLVLAFKGVIEIIKILWETVLEPLVSFFKNIFIKIIQSVIEIWNAWKPVIEPIINILLVLWNSVLKPIVTFLGGIFLNVFKSVFTAIGSVIGNLKQIFGGIIDFVTGVFTGNWSKAWQGVKDIFGGIMGGLGAILKVPLNAVIGLINGAIGGLNKISIDIPSWVPGFGGKNFGVNIPKIPYLAKGGIVDSPTLAMVGEDGRKILRSIEEIQYKKYSVNSWKPKFKEVA